MELYKQWGETKSSGTYLTRFRVFFKTQYIVSTVLPALFTKYCIVQCISWSHRHSPLLRKCHHEKNTYRREGHGGENFSSSDKPFQALRMADSSSLFSKQIRLRGTNFLYNSFLDDFPLFRTSIHTRVVCSLGRPFSSSYKLHSLLYLRKSEP